jgi:hypothetical protein
MLNGNSAHSTVTGADSHASLPPGWWFCRVITWRP